MTTTGTAHGSRDTRPLAHAGDEWRPFEGSGLIEAAKSALGALAISAPLMIGGYLMARAASRPSDPLAELLAAPARAMLTPASATRGYEIFVGTCAACHKPDGTGVPGLGKSLVSSQFVATLNDEALAKFVATGRGADDPLNTTKVPMPPLGGNASLTGEDLKDVVLFVRALQDHRRMPVLEAMLPKEDPNAPFTPTAEQLAAAGGDAELAEFIASGAKLFTRSCAACHGPDARGAKGLGKDLVNSEFTAKLTDDEFLAFVKKGRNPGDPLNTTGVDMPPKGGNPALSDDDLLDIIAYLRSIHTPAKAAK